MVNLKIRMDNPCSEKWSKMTDDVNGRFCDLCQQTVTDFTHFSDKDLVNWFIESQGKSCGRFKPEQLDRLILNKPNFSINKFKPSLIAASLIAFLSFPKLSNAQVIKPTIDQTDGFKTKVSKSDIIVSDTLKVIRGRVLDKDDKTPLPGVSLMINDSLRVGMTNKDGVFEIKLQERFDETKIMLTATYIGYKTLNSLIDLKKGNHLNLELCVSTEMLGGPEIYYVRSPSIWDRLRQVFGKKN